jgi:hypothetical protein
MDLHDARALALFSNLAPSDTDYFRHNYLGFVPDIWWQMSVLYSEAGEKPLLWQWHQKTLRETWKEGFPLGKCVRLIAAGSFPYELLQAQIARQNDIAPELVGAEFAPNVVALDRRRIEPNSQMPILESTPGTFEIDPGGMEKYQKTYPFMEGLIFLAAESWRARVCEECGNRFVAEKPGNRFCSVRCRSAARKLSKRDWWRQSGKEWRSKQRRKKK